MTTSIASPDPWPIVAPENAALPTPVTAARATPAGGARPPRSARGMLDDAALLLLVALLFPVLILVIGTPIALLVRLLMTITQLL